MRGRLVLESESTLKELMRCMKMQEKWPNTGLKSLSASLRSLAEAVLKVGACKQVKAERCLHY